MKHIVNEQFWSEKKKNSKLEPVSCRNVHWVLKEPTGRIKQKKAHFKQGNFLTEMY